MNQRDRSVILAELEASMPNASLPEQISAKLQLEVLLDIRDVLHHGCITTRAV